MKLLLVFTGLALASFSQDVMEDFDFFGCDEKTDGWYLLNISNLPNTAITISSEHKDGKGSLEFNYRRVKDKLPLLLNFALTTNLEAIEMDIWSKETTTLAVGLEDREKASFHQAINVGAGKWQHVVCKAGDFRQNDDSPVKKNKLDVKLLTAGFGLADAAPYFGSEGANVVRIDNLKVVRKPLRKIPIPAKIDKKTFEIATEGFYEGDVSVKNGGTLRITAPRFVFRGNVMCSDSTFEVKNCSFTAKGRFPHDMSFSASGSSAVRFESCIASFPFMVGASFVGKSTFTLSKCWFPNAGFTGDVQSGANLFLEGVDKPGEFILGSGCAVSASESKSLIFWLPAGENARTSLKLPDGNEIKEWSIEGKLGLSLDVKSCAGIMWCLVSTPGAELEINASAIYAVGIYIGGESVETISGLNNGKMPESGALEMKDRKIIFMDSSVAVWNVYGADKANVTIRNSKVGETFSLQNSTVTLEDSTCDGKGGYIRAGHGSRLRMVRCKTSCPVIAVNMAEVTLEECDINGNICARDNSCVTLLKTKVSGELQKFNGGKISKEK